MKRGCLSHALAVTRFPSGLSASVLVLLQVLVAARARAVEPTAFWLEHFRMAAWETVFDHDGDGFNAAQEFEFGTDPNNPNSVPLRLVPAQDGWLFEFSVVSGINYTLETSTNLIDFTPVSIVPGQNVQYPTSEPARFFRYTQPVAPNSDGDCFLDFEEVLYTGTDPLKTDSDGDGLNDCDEVTRYRTNPNFASSTGRGRISGKVMLDEDGDPSTRRHPGVSGWKVFLDTNYDGTWQENEPMVLSAADGAYEFSEVDPGVYWVALEPRTSWSQIFPETSPPYIVDGAVDRVVGFEDSKNGPIPAPYGRNKLNEPIRRLVLGGKPEPVSLDVLVGPLPPRPFDAPIGSWSDVDFLTISSNSAVTVEFVGEELTDGPGADLAIGSLDNAGEKAEIYMGDGPDRLQFVATIGEGGDQSVDLAGKGITRPVRFIQLRSLNNQGSFPGYDLVGFEALNYRARSRGHYEVVVEGGQMSGGIDFGVLGVDRPPRVFLSSDPFRPRAGESFDVRVTTSDDLGIASVSLSLLGTPAAIGANGTARVTVPSSGVFEFVGSVTDSIGQTAQSVLPVLVLNADGSLPDLSGLGVEGIVGDTNAPMLRVVSPVAGQIVVAGSPIHGSIAPGAGRWPVESWQLHIAPADLVDPQKLGDADPDYVLLAEGVGAVPLGVMGNFPATLTRGPYLIRLSAKGTATASIGFVVGVGMAESELRPSVTVTSPAQNSTARYLTPIRATIASQQPLREWYVEYARASEVNLENLGAAGPKWIRLAAGTETVQDGVLATFDPTVLPDDSYVVRIAAWNRLGLGWVEPLPLEVSGAPKLGQFSTTFTDLKLELAGVPIEVRRTYSTIESTRQGDFGFGWSLALFHADVRETVPNRGTALVPTPFREGARVYLNAPDGRRIGFTFHAKPGRASFIGQSYQAEFKPDPGEKEYTLGVPEGDQSFLTVDSTGNTYLFFVKLPYNPSTYILTNRLGTRYTYDERSGLQEIADTLGNRVVFSPTAIQHSSGTRITFQRDALGRITQMIDPDGAVTHYRYSPQGDLVEVEYPAGVKGSFGYSPSSPHYLTDINDPLRQPTQRVEYGADGRVTAILDAAGNRSVQNWNPGGFSGTFTDALGGVRQITYDALGNVTREVDPLGGITQWSFGDTNNPTRPTVKTDARGNKTTYKYDTRGNLLSEDGPNRLTGRSYAYDASGRMTNITQSVIPSRQKMVYDSQGKMASYTDGSRTFEAVYTENGLPSTFSDSEQGLFRFEYTNGLSRPSRVYSSEGRMESFEYTPAGNLRRHVDAAGGVTEVVYDALRRPVRQIDPLGGQTVVEWDEVHPGLPKSRTDAAGRRTVFRYTANGQLAEIEGPGGVRVKNEYDAAGNHTAVIDPAGNRTSYAYDLNRQLIRETDPLGNARLHRYDAVGNRIETIDRNGRKRSFIFDAANRMTEERWHVSADSTNVIRVIRWDYDRKSRLTRAEDPDATVDLSYSFDNELRTTERVTYPGRPLKHIGYDRDSRMRLTEVGFLGVSGLRFTRQTDGSLAYLGWSVSGGPSARVTFLRDSRGDVAEILRGTNQFTTNVMSRTLAKPDPRGWLNSFQHLTATGSPLPGGDWTSVRNGVGDLLQLVRDGTTNGYAYDEAGQLALVTTNGVSAEAYVYDAAGNRVTSHRHGAYVTGPANRLAQAGPWTLVHDLEGNLLTKSNGLVRFEYFWDHRNRLTSVNRSVGEGPLVELVHYRYDAFDRRVAVVRGEETRWTYFAEQHAAAEFVGTNGTPSKVWFQSDEIDKPLAYWTPERGIEWLLNDHLGTPLQVLQFNGDEVARLKHDSYGNVLEISGASSQSAAGLGGTGRDIDADTGLQWHRARWYDPDTGRFLSEDPWGFKGRDSNLYRYAANQPTKFRDPTGHVSAIEYRVLEIMAYVSEGLAYCDLAKDVYQLWAYVAANVVAALNGNPLPGHSGLAPQVKEMAPGWGDLMPFNPGCLMD